MAYNSCILLYSKYSVSSKKLTDFINSSGLDTNLINLQNVCIDNEEVRKRILNNKQIGITSVPCLLLVYQDGGIEKYDGDVIFRWFEEIANKFIQTKIPEEKSIEVKKVQNIKKEKTVTSIDDLVSEEDIEQNDNINDNDRYKNKKPNKLIRIDKDNYTEDENLYQGTPPNNRENEKSAIKKSEATDIMSKAKELAKGRESEIQHGNPK
jgi:hypothetical protein